MDVKTKDTVGGSLQISTEVIARIAKMATMEIEGVQEVSAGGMMVRSLFGKANLQRAVAVEMSDGVAELTVSMVVKYGTKIPPVCEKVQENVKTSIQNMTGITVSKVNIVVSGVAPEEEASAEPIAK